MALAFLVLQKQIFVGRRPWMPVPWSTSLISLAVVLATGCLPSLEHSDGNSQAAHSRQVQQASNALKAFVGVVAVAVQPPASPQGRWLLIVTTSHDAAPRLVDNAQSAVNAILGTSPVANVVVQQLPATTILQLGPWQISAASRWPIVLTGVGLLLAIAAMAALLAHRHRGSNAQ